MHTIRFVCADVRLTPELTQALARAGQDVDALCRRLVARHEEGEWGDVQANQRTVNDVAVLLGKGIVKSVFVVEPVGEIWLMTSLNSARHLPPQTFVMLAGQAFQP